MSGGNGTLMRSERMTVMGSMAERYSMDPGKLLDTIKATCIKGNATSEQVQAFLIVANRYGLDPFLKEIHAFAGQGGGIVPIVGIDGWSKIANHTGKLDGVEFSYEGDGPDLSCTCTIYVKDRTHPVRVTEYMSECGRNTPPWKQYPRRMLRHKAFMQCVRVAFGLGGIYDEDEAKDIQTNEAGRPSVKRLDDLNTAIANHPTDDTRVIDHSTNNLSPDEAEQIINNAPRAAEPQEPDVSGTDAEPPQADLSSYDGFVAALKAARFDTTGLADDERFNKALAQIGTDHAVKVPGKKGDSARKYVFEAAVNGAIDWTTGKVVG